MCNYYFYYYNYYVGSAILPVRQEGVIHNGSVRIIFLIDVIYRLRKLLSHV